MVDDERAFLEDWKYVRLIRASVHGMSCLGSGVAITPDEHCKGEQVGDNPLARAPIESFHAISSVDSVVTF